jgi:protein-S-isoprenylcysteine O-methyltransferase Ste14
MPHAIDPANPMHAIYWAWAIWYASWIASLFWSGRPAAKPRMRAHAANQLATILGVLLLFWLPSWHTPYAQLWTPAPWGIWMLFALVVLAFAFCWWARIVMGRLWSGFVSRTDDHRVIDTGPFALVRHPIYAAIAFAAFSTAVAQATAAGLAGAACLTLGFWLKARLEERFLIRELEAGAYDSYRRRVPMLIPFWPKSA